MLLHIIARGKIGRSPEAELVDRYLTRIAWDTKLTELPETGGRIPPPKEPFRTVALDEKGRDLPSEKLAAILGDWRDGGIRETRAEEVRNKHPERLIESAVRGMLPHNRVGRAQFRKLKVYKGSAHPHEAQKPTPLELKTRVPR